MIKAKSNPTFPRDIIFSSSFKNFLLVLCEFNIMHTNPTHLPLPSYLSFILATNASLKHRGNFSLWEL